MFTGGGSAGHVTPSFPLIDACLKAGWQVSYVGSYHGIESRLVPRQNIPYYPIRTGKLRRYFSWQNFIDPFNLLIGFCQAFFYCLKVKPQVIFSKGGFVSFPVVLAAWVNRIPVIAHESDLTPGLANRLAYPFIKTQCVTFEAGLAYFKDKPKARYTGTPIRAHLLQGDAEQGRALCGFDNTRPILLIMGGGQGAGPINDVVRAALPQLLTHYQVIHLCGEGKIDPALQTQPGYKQIEYAHEALADLFACAHLVISRAGANALYELLALRKPHLLIPLSQGASRGDQVSNARHFESAGMSAVLSEVAITPEKLLASLSALEKKYHAYETQLKAVALPQSTPLIFDLLQQAAK